MHDLPHRYAAAVSAGPEGNVRISSPSLTDIESAPPAEFGGPGDRWSPETLLAAAVADCFVLSFRAIARGFKMEWQSLRCEVEAVLDRVDKVTRFTEFHLRVVLDVPQGIDEAKARRLLEKAEQACLITNSLKSDTHLDAEVRVGG